MSGLLVAVVALFIVIVVASMRFFYPHDRQLFVGYLSVASLISMFASPLFIIVSSSAMFHAVSNFYVMHVLSDIYLPFWFAHARIWSSKPGA